MLVVKASYVDPYAFGTRFDVWGVPCRVLEQGREVLETELASSSEKVFSGNDSVPGSYIIHIIYVWSFI